MYLGTQITLCEAKISILKTHYILWPSTKWSNMRSFYKINFYISILFLPCCFTQLPIGSMLPLSIDKHLIFILSQANQISTGYVKKRALC